MECEQLLQIAKPTNNDIMLIISKLIASNQANFEELKQTNLEIKLSLEKSIYDLQEDVKTNQQRVTLCEKDIESNSDQLKAMVNEVNYLKQKNMENEIIIVGLPAFKINDREFIQKLDAIYQFGSENVKECYINQHQQLGRGNRNKSMGQAIIKFKNLESKTELMTKVRNNGPICIKQLYPTYGKQDQKIFIRERLTQTNMIILKHLLQMRKDKKLLYCWFRNNNIYVKIKEDEKSRIIRSVEEAMQI